MYRAIIFDNNDSFARVVVSELLYIRKQDVLVDTKGVPYEIKVGSFNNQVLVLE